MEIIYFLPAISFVVLWGWIWFRIFREAGYASPGWLTVLFIVPFTTVPTLLWFLFREKPIQMQRRAARVAAGTATPDEVERTLGYAIALEVRGNPARASEIYDQIAKGWPDTEEGAEAIRRKTVLSTSSN